MPACRSEFRELTKMRVVLRSSSYFLVYSRSNSSDSFRYTEKKSARELFVLNGSKNSLRAEWRLKREVQCLFSGGPASNNNEMDVPFWIELNDRRPICLHPVQRKGSSARVGVVRRVPCEAGALRRLGAKAFSAFVPLHASDGITTAQ